LLGNSPALEAIRSDLEAAAQSQAKVLITGETGVGKEVVARHVHQHGVRRMARLTTVNCAGVPDSLLESELFGHVRGSFTGAYRDKPGVLEAAANGTVFLDEVGEMTPRMQAVLLRFLETGELQRVGADRAHTRVDVRVIAATNRDLVGQVATGGFREDLYYRLNVIRIHVPPLRERREDIPLLVEHFVALCSSHYGSARPVISREALDLLTAYDWPGNIRQLRNVTERALLRANGSVINAADLPADVRPASRIAVAQPAAPVASAAELEAAPFVAQLRAGESFWAVVYPAFMSRDITRATLRAILSDGLQRSAGNYRMLTELFNMPRDDYKRFLSFLRKHDCQVPFKPYRSGAVPLAGREVSEEYPAAATA
jgi:transcriptional regulator with GAF, ATPase, and Fis domain